MDWTIAERPEFLVVGYKIRTTNTQETDPQTSQIPDLWQRVVSERLPERVPNRKDPSTLYAVL